MSHPAYQKLRRIWQTLLWLGLLASLAAGQIGFCGDVAFTEYQVKALFLLNFTRYIDWPETAFAGSNAPITIGVFGEDHFGDALQNAVADRRVNGRSILIEHLENTNDVFKCQVLFISSSEIKRQRQLLAQLQTAPVLTVGESDNFADQGGAINFIKKDGKIRLEINVGAARQANLQISSKLLRVADVVKGGPK
jgi:hypothetical protein